MTRVLIIGGYGNFGSFIARELARDKDIELVIAGRSAPKAEALARELGAQGCAIDIENNLDEKLAEIKPSIVIHTSGPFQSQGYAVAQTCIRHKCHYIDLADGRDFVTQIAQLEGDAKEAGVLVVSGASSVPCLTSAIMDAYKDQFSQLESVEYGIATAQKTNRGLATTQAVLSYAGKPFTARIGGKNKTIYGWQNFRMRNFWGLGWRSLGNCDIPDLDLFPVRYPNLKTIRFYAGLELPFIHLGLWAMSWVVRTGLIKNLAVLARPLLALSRVFDRIGTDKSAFFMKMSGKIQGDKPKDILFNLVACSGDGPYIPCIPSILLARKLARGEMRTRGAMPCMGLVTLDEYLEALKSYDIRWNIEIS